LAQACGPFGGGAGSPGAVPRRFRRAPRSAGTVAPGADPGGARAAAPTARAGKSPVPRPGAGVTPRRAQLKLGGPGAAVLAPAQARRPRSRAASEGALPRQWRGRAVADLAASTGAAGETPARARRGGPATRGHVAPTRRLVHGARHTTLSNTGAASCTQTGAGKPQHADHRCRRSGAAVCGRARIPPGGAVAAVPAPASAGANAATLYLRTRNGDASARSPARALAWPNGSPRRIPAALSRTRTW
jgi:hypothetical protein